jgi:low affinity Fe/Cu permease
MFGTGSALGRFPAVPKQTIRQSLYVIGCRFSDAGANIAGHPMAQIVLVIFCLAWFLLPLGQDATAVLTLVLSVLAITLTQMVLNQQKRHEVALHLKIDELIHAMKGARDEVMGVESKSEAELEALRITGDIAEEELAQRRGKSVVTTEANNGTRRAANP